MTIELIDSLVKILIGVVVSGALYLIISKKKDKPFNLGLTELNAKREQLEYVARKVGNVHYIYQQYIALVIEFTRYGKSWPQARRDELNKMTRELVEAFVQLTDAESTLLLLGEKKLERALRSYGAKIVSIRRLVYSERVSFTGEELVQIEESKKDIAQLKETFFDTLSDRYNPRKTLKFATNN
ncbi:MAG: energy transducer TonB [Saccharospirillaceae bacterium]|nr:hypothetical protein [Pseudomonadales bacterium]NRB77870.1 energy transducer TonB [Saccharospirillaceae bacterium]